MKRSNVRSKTPLLVLALLMSLVLSLGLIYRTVLCREGAERPAAPASASLDLAQRIDLAAGCLGGSPTQEEQQPARQVYQLSDSDPVAPLPDPKGYGTLESPQQIQALFADAETLLDGETFFFSAASPVMPASEVRYYFDETILTVTWKEVHDDCVYTFAEVKIAHPSQFRRFLADGEYGSVRRYYTSQMAQSVNAVLASSGDFYGYRPTGTIVYNGGVYRVDKSNLHICMVDENGDLQFTYAKAFPDKQSVEAYVAEHGIRFSLAFGPVLVEDGAIRDFGVYGLGEVRDGFPRAGLCQLGPCHYLLATANREGAHRTLPNMQQFAQVLLASGCDKAYALDGGQTASLFMDGHLLNSVSHGSERQISDIIYFATAMP